MELLLLDRRSCDAAIVGLVHRCRFVVVECSDLAVRDSRVRGKSGGGHAKLYGISSYQLE